jgi:hypothetical protein
MTAKEISNDWKMRASRLPIIGTLRTAPQRKEAVRKFSTLRAGVL